MNGKNEVRRMRVELQAVQAALAVEKDRTSSLLRMILSMGNEIESLRDATLRDSAPSAPQALAALRELVALNDELHSGAWKHKDDHDLRDAAAWAEARAIVAGEKS